MISILGSGIYFWFSVSLYLYSSLPCLPRTLHLLSLTLVKSYSSFKAVVLDLLGVMGLLLFKWNIRSHSFKRNIHRYTFCVTFWRRVDFHPAPKSTHIYRSSSLLFNCPYIEVPLSLHWDHFENCHCAYFISDYLFVEKITNWIKLSGQAQQ